jgi:hypothetical protein
MDNKMFAFLSVVPLIVMIYVVMVNLVHSKVSRKFEFVWDTNYVYVLDKAKNTKKFVYFDEIGKEDGVVVDYLDQVRAASLLKEGYLYTDFLGFEVRNNIVLFFSLSWTEEKFDLIFTDMDEAFLSCVNNFLLSKKILKGEI